MSIKYVDMYTPMCPWNQGKLDLDHSSVTINNLACSIWPFWPSVFVFAEENYNLYFIDVCGKSELVNIKKHTSHIVT